MPCFLCHLCQSPCRPMYVDLSLYSLLASPRKVHNPIQAQYQYLMDRVWATSKYDRQPFGRVIHTLQTHSWPLSCIEPRGIFKRYSYPKSFHSQLLTRNFLCESRLIWQVITRTQRRSSNFGDVSSFSWPGTGAGYQEHGFKSLGKDPSNVRSYLLVHTQYEGTEEGAWA